jgi:hypothetical protein
MYLLCVFSFQNDPWVDLLLLSINSFGKPAAAVSRYLSALAIGHRLFDQSRR